MKARAFLPILLVAGVMIACGKTTFTQVDLLGLVYQEGDLSEYGSAPGLRPVKEKMDWSYDNWVQVQVFDKENSADLLVDVVLFSDKKELEKAYAEFPNGVLQETMSPFDPPEIGEKIIGKKQEWSLNTYAVNWTFTRCYSLVNIWVQIGGQSPFTAEGLRTYAQALDKRLNNSVCPI